jgi:hypothetical protein
MQYIITFEKIEAKKIGEQELAEILRDAEADSDYEYAGHDYDDRGYFLVDMS